MQIKLLRSLILSLAIAAMGYSQTISIAPRKVVYVRKFQVLSEGKKTFAISYPVISGAIPPAMKSKLENTISYWRIFDTSLKKNLREDDWLDSLHYKVIYNKRGVLDIALTEEGWVAYPDSKTVNMVIDLKTGERVSFAEAFINFESISSIIIFTQKLKL